MTSPRVTGWWAKHFVNFNLDVPTPQFGMGHLSRVPASFTVAVDNPVFNFDGGTRETAEFALTGLNPQINVDVTRVPTSFDLNVPARMDFLSGERYSESFDITVPLEEGEIPAELPGDPELLWVGAGTAGANAFQFNFESEAAEGDYVLVIGTKIGSSQPSFSNVERDGVPLDFIADSEGVRFIAGAIAFWGGVVPIGKGGNKEIVASQSGTVQAQEMLWVAMTFKNVTSARNDDVDGLYFTYPGPFDRIILAKENEMSLIALGFAGTYHNTPPQNRWPAMPLALQGWGPGIVPFVSLGQRSSLAIGINSGPTTFTWTEPGNWGGNAKGIILSGAAAIEKPKGEGTFKFIARERYPRDFGIVVNEPSINMAGRIPQRGSFGIACPTPTFPIRAREAVAPQEFLLTATNLSWPIPDWCDAFDMVALGAGAGGDSGKSAYTNGWGGGAGGFTSKTIKRGVDLAWNITTLTITVATGPGQLVNGGATSMGPTGVGGLGISGAGGLCGAGGNQYGRAPGTHAFNGRYYHGGIQDIPANGANYSGWTGCGDGNLGGPGTGGAGGRGALVGGDPGGVGCRGQAWVYCYQLFPPPIRT